MNAQVNNTLVIEDLVAIQHELKAPKDKFNSFGKYNYRSCESILEAVKPLLHKYNCTLVLSDQSKELCGIPVVTAIAKFIDSKGKETVVQAEAGVEVMEIAPGCADDDHSPPGHRSCLLPALGFQIPSV